MNSMKQFFRKNREAMKTRTAKAGIYSFIAIVLAFAILIAVNVAAGLLPDSATQYDISAAQLYSVTSSTRAVVSNLNSDVTIYWIAQSGQEDTVIEKLLNVYESLSDHITVTKINPDVYPTFAAQYTDETVANNSLIVECSSRYRYIAYDDIYETDTTSYFTTGSVAYSFDGESEITTAIDYVVSEDLPQMYLLTGHGEADLSDSFTKMLAKQNIDTVTFSLLNVDEIPEEADGIIINSPTSDISTEEADMLKDYIANGGHVLILSGPQDADTQLDNLHSVAAEYGMDVQDGIVIEGNRNNYAFQVPYALLPTLSEDNDITSEIASNNSYIIVPIAQGMKLSNVSSATVSELLSTTDESFSKLAGFALTTYEKEDDDTDGPFAVAASAEVSSTGGRLVYIASDNVMNDTYVSYSSGANSDFVMNSISWLIGETQSISIASKSLDYSYLTISSSQANLIKVCLIAVMPLIFLVCGIDTVVRRRKKA